MLLFPVFHKRIAKPYVSVIFQAFFRCDGFSCYFNFDFPVRSICPCRAVFCKPGKRYIFCQERVGREAKVFRIIKLKTMTDERDADGNLLPDEKRLTGIGKLVRSVSVDELPQLINVLKGDMSLIGPRPLLKEYLPLYSPEQARRHEVLPGISGWAQVNGRNAISWTRKFELDIWYVDHYSFGLDLKIIFFTAMKVLKREGIRSATSVTMERFNGNN